MHCCVNCEQDCDGSFPSLHCTGYGGFDDYGGYNNYGYGNDGYDDRMRDGRGKRITGLSEKVVLVLELRDTEFPRQR